MDQGQNEWLGRLKHDKEGEQSYNVKIKFTKNNMSSSGNAQYQTEIKVSWRITTFSTGGLPSR